MGGNPLVLGFLALTVLLFVALGVLAVLQRRMYADQLRQVRDLLREARELSADGRADEEGSASAEDESGRDSER